VIKLTSKRVAFVIVLLTQFITVTSFATSIDPSTWEELIIEADFVGVVECTVAGGIVAEYEVVESWKGAAVGSSMRIRTPPGSWGASFPSAFIGERFIVAAKRLNRREGGLPMSSIFFGWPSPLRGRRIAADYTLPAYEGRAAASWTNAFGLRGLGTSQTTLEAYREDVKALLALETSESFFVLRANIRKYVFVRANPIQRQEPELRALDDQLNNCKSVTCLMEALMVMCDTGTPSMITAAQEAIKRSIDAEILVFLRALAPDAWPFFNQTRKSMIELLAYLADQRENGPPAEVDSPPDTPSADALHALREALAKGPDEQHRFYRAFQSLTHAEPDRVLAWLLEWVPEKDPEMAYVLASMYIFDSSKDESDRRADCEAMLGAKDPYIRVAGGVYLCYEDERAGTAALRKLFPLEGDPGLWATLALLRRGYKEFMPRALRALDEHNSLYTPTGNPRRNLLLRFELLLSNSAKTSKVPQPPRRERFQAVDDMEKTLRTFRDSYESWWAEYGAAQSAGANSCAGYPSGYTVSCVRRGLVVRAA